MIAFMKGTIYSAQADSVIIENNGIGYRVYTPNPQALRLGQEAILYTYQQVREDDISLFGFENMEGYEVFVRLISVKGVGARTALGMLAACSPKQIIAYIENNDVKALKALPGIGAAENEELALAMEALKSLGYRSGELASLQKELAGLAPMQSDAYIRKALSILAKKSGV